MKCTAHQAGPLRRLRWLSSGVLVAAMVAIPMGPAPAAHAASSTDLQYVNAVVDASLAHVQVTWRGWLVLDRDVTLWGSWYEAKGVYGPWTVKTTCSGYVASPEGAVVTAGHCVDAEGMAGGTGAILSQAVQGITSNPAHQAAAYAALAANASIEGTQSGSPPDRTVRTTVPALSMKARPTSVQDVQPFVDGDVALLTVNGLEAPTLPLADAEPESGVAVVASGYSGAVSEVVDSDTPPSFNEGSVSGTETVNGTPFTSISSRTSPGMSGGPVVDMDGYVVGTVSWAPAGSESSSDFMTTVGSLTSILEGNGVDNTVGEAEQAYRDGLAYYFQSRYHDAVAEFDTALALQPGWKMVTEFRQQAVASYPDDVAPPTSDEGGGVPVWVYAVGGAVVLLIVAGTGLFLVRRRRTPPAPATPTVLATPPAPEPAGPPVAAPPAPSTAAPAPVAPVAAPAVAPAPEPEQVVTPPAPAPSAGQHVFCPNCGSKHAPGVHYCEDCGQPLFPATVPTEQETS